MTWAAWCIIEYLPPRENEDKQCEWLHFYSQGHLGVLDSCNETQYMFLKQANHKAAEVMAWKAEVKDTGICWTTFLTQTCMFPKMSKQNSIEGWQGETFSWYSLQT